jgi:uncharacterized protein YdaL
MLRNLLGHFDAQVDLVPVQQYTAGAGEQLQRHLLPRRRLRHQLPAAFLADAATTKTLVWFKYNLWQLAWNPAYNFTQPRASTSRLRGHERDAHAPPTQSRASSTPSSTRAWTSSSTTSTTRPQRRQRGPGHRLDHHRRSRQGADARAACTTRRDRRAAPYITRSGNFWYVADLPFSFIGPRDRYLVFADLLHDMLGIPTPRTTRRWCGWRTSARWCRCRR